MSIREFLKKIDTADRGVITMTTSFFSVLAMSHEFQHDYVIFKEIVSGMSETVLLSDIAPLLNKIEACRIIQHLKWNMQNRIDQTVSVVTRPSENMLFDLQSWFNHQSSMAKLVKNC
jgi:hypothetical protein